MTPGGQHDSETPVSFCIKGPLPNQKLKHLLGLSKMEILARYPFFYQSNRLNRYITNSRGIEGYYLDLTPRSFVQERQKTKWMNFKDFFMVFSKMYPVRWVSVTETA